MILHSPLGKWRPMNVLNTLLLIPFLCRYHPLYITDSQEGGLGQKTGLDARKQTAYAGVEYDEDGNAIPIGGKYELHSFKDHLSIPCTIS